MAAESKVRKAERLANQALSGFRTIVQKLEAANVLHVQAHDEHVAQAYAHKIASAAHTQAAIDQVLAVADNNAVKDKLTDLLGNE